MISIIQNELNVWSSSVGIQTFSIALFDAKTLLPAAADRRVRRPHPCAFLLICVLVHMLMHMYDRSSM